MSWFQRTTSAPSFQFGATAVLAGGFTAAALLSYQHIRRSEAIHDLKASIPELDKDHRGDQVCTFSVEGDVALTWKGKLMGEVKLTTFGAASPPQNGEKELVLSKEDKRSAELAARAQAGDYDDGAHSVLS